jgi:DNA adenine methylase
MLAMPADASEGGLVRYMGGKARQAPALCDVIAERWSGIGPDGYRATIWEPFMGGANMTAGLGRRFPNHTIIAADANESLSIMWRAIVDGWEPPGDVISREEWAEWKAAPHSALRGWYGTAASFNGHFYAAYGACCTDKHGKYINFTGQSARAVGKQRPYLGNVIVRTGDYRVTCEPSPGDLVYCDPPYEATGVYRAVKGFDHPAFWDWCNVQVARGVSVFVSEYKAPEGWTSVYATTRKVSMGAHSGAANGTPTEHLWTR